jgi:toxin ParE1/3/4
MPVVRRTATAENDRVDIWLKIAADDPDAADRLLKQIDRKCALLAGNSLLARARPDIAPELRSLTLGSNLILFRYARKALRSSPSSTAPDDWTGSRDPAGSTEKRDLAMRYAGSSRYSNLNKSLTRLPFNLRRIAHDSHTTRYRRTWPGTLGCARFVACNARQTWNRHP